MSQVSEVSSLPWRPVLPAGRAAMAVAVSRQVAERLRLRERVEIAAAAAARQTGFPQSVHWEPYGLAQGDAGLALMCGYLDACFPGEGWDVTGHEYLTLAASGAERVAFPPTGLFGGLSGLAFAVWSLSRDSTRYQRLSKTVEDALLAETVALAETLALARPGMPVGQFDLISGLSGVGAYLLCRQAQGAVAAALRAVLRSFVTMIMEEEGVPRWYTPPHLMGDEAIARHYPLGNLNCGLAHGIPGPLTLMALALTTGVEVPGLVDAVERSARWLVDHRADDAWGVNWPVVVPLTPNGSPPAPEPSRSAWCYGSPGVARALWLAGKATDQPKFCEQAVEAMEAVYRRPLRERRIDSPTFCHGVAGLLQITLRFAHDTGRSLFAEAAGMLSEQLLALYEPDTLLGYRNVEPGGQRVDQPGLLDGSPGVALVLLAASTSVEPNWDRAFLLA